MKLIDLDISHIETISDLKHFYTEVYIDNFPDDERESLDNLIYYLQAKINHKEYRYHISLVKNDNAKIVGGAIYNYYPECKSGVIEFLAVKKDLQSNGIGTLIYHHVLKVLQNDANQTGRNKLEYIFCEIDSPEYSTDSIKKYLYFWDKQNYKHLDFTYIQPALSENQNPVSGLWLTVSPQNSVMATVPSKLIKHVIYNYMKYAMKITNPEENKYFCQMRDELIKKENISLLNIL